MFSSAHLRTAAIRSPERTLLVVQALWLLVAGSATLIFLIALPSRWAALTHPSPELLANLGVLGLSPTAYAGYTLFWEIVIVVPWVVTGFVIFRRCGDQRMALVTALVLVVFSVGNGTITPTLRTLLHLHPALDALLHTYEFLAWYGFTLFFYLFPNGRFVPEWTRWLAFLWLPIFAAWNYAADTPLAPLNWPSYLSVPLIGFQWVSWIFSQSYRYWRVSSEAERQQTLWVTLAAVTIIVIMITTTVIGAFVPGYSPISEAQSTPQALAYLLLQFPLVLVFALLPIAIGAAITQHRLWGMDRLVSRAFIYGVLTMFVVLVYDLVVSGLGALLHGSSHLLISLVVTGLIAIAFNPLRLRLEYGINRLMYGERDAPYTVLARLGRHLDTALAPETVLRTIIETICQTLKLPGATIMVYEDQHPRTVASIGRVDDKSLTLPLTHQHSLIGELRVTPRALDESFSANECLLLETIASQVSIVVHQVRLTSDLRRSREQIVTAREEERRRLRRDLHDGLGPRLAGQTLKLEAARDAIESDPATTRVLLSEMLGESQALIAEIRRLIYGLRPPVLDQLGLLGTIREQVMHFQQTELQIRLDTPDALPPLPAAVDVAAYYIIQEALVNVVRHSQARHCTVSIAAGATLSLSIVDDGIGLPEAIRSGIGLGSIRERAEEIGGSCLISSGAPQGTRVLVWLPLERSMTG